jgi:hypothetical protein
MITFPNDLTPVPKFPGYFWDVVAHKLYSIKVGGVLREMTLRRANQFNANRWNGMRTGQLHYSLSREGFSHTVTVVNLKKLKMTDYAIPLINKVKV